MFTKILVTGFVLLLAVDFDSYSSFLDVNASLIDSQNQTAMASKNHNPNS